MKYDAKKHVHVKNQQYMVTKHYSFVCYLGLASNTHKSIREGIRMIGFVGKGAFLLLTEFIFSY